MIVNSARRKWCEQEGCGSYSGLSSVSAFTCIGLKEVRRFRSKLLQSSPLLLSQRCEEEEPTSGPWRYLPGRPECTWTRRCCSVLPKKVQSPADGVMSPHLRLFNYVWVHVQGVTKHSLTTFEWGHNIEFWFPRKHVQMKWKWLQLLSRLCETGLSVCVSPVSLSRFLNTGWRWGGALDLSLLSLWAAQQQTAALSVCPTLLATSLTSPCRCVEVLERTQRSLKVLRNLC